MAGIYRRGKVYWARAQRKGHEYRASLETTDRGVAKRRFEQWLDKLESLAWGERPRITFAEAVKQFILQHFPTMKPKSSQRYGVSLKHLGEAFDGKYIDEINKLALADFEARRREDGVSAPTIRRDLACLSSIFSFCEDKDWMGEGGNIVKAYLRKRSKRGLKESPPRTRYLTHAEERALLAAANPKLRAVIALAIDTGLREQEMFSLTWGQIDLLNNTIRTTRDTKNGRARSVPLPERSAQVLAQWKSQNIGVLRSLYVIHDRRGKRFKNHYRAFKSLVTRLGMGDVNWHDLRRTAACRWLQDYGLKIHEVSILLGHSGIQVTEKSYAFLDQQRVAEETAAQIPAHPGASRPIKAGDN